jgi:hypothetical protein
MQAYYLRRRDTLRALASDLEIAEEAVCATVMKQLFEGLSVSLVAEAGRLPVQNSTAIPH